jgi:iron complex transport system substrate-binding protein
LGGEDKLVGRSSTATFPDSVAGVPIVGDSSASPNVELLLEQEPDLVLADTMLSSKTEILAQIENTGIPVVIEKTTNTSRLDILVNNIGLFLGAETKAAELVDWMNYYINLVNTRVANLSESQKPSVYFEWSVDTWKGINPNSGLGGLVSAAGGVNIVVSNSTATSTILSPEYVLEQDPDFIIRVSSQTNNSIADLQNVRNELLTRTALSDVAAVKEGHVYVYNYKITQGIQFPIGQLYFAKWLHPDLFADIDPTAVHEEMMQKFFGMKLGDACAYPEIATVFDITGAQVTVNLPVNRIVCLNAGIAEVIYALGEGDKVVGRGETCTSPPAIVEKPVAGASSTYPNMEVIFELEPDLVIVDTMIKAENLEQFKNGGIPVMIETSSNNSRLNTVLTNLGILLNAEETATELVDWIDHYSNLVSDRIANISMNERPTVYLEVLSTQWRTANTNSGYGSLINLAGGLNIAPTNTSTTFPTISPEYVVEENPDVIVVMVSQNPVGTLEELQAKRTEMLERSVLSETNAIKDGRVYAFNSKLTSGLLHPIGLLYTAKCLYPDLFTDIDPAAIQEAMFQKYFGINVDGAYCIPLNTPPS